MASVGIAGVTGYTGIQLLNLLSSHPSVEITFVSSQSQAGKPLSEVFPFYSGSLKLQKLDFNHLPDVDILFLALPHGESIKEEKNLQSFPGKIIDLSADYRIPKSNGHSSDWVFGLPEAFRNDIATSNRVSNPGCYPTSAILALLPLKEFDLGNIIVDSKSGVSGAGKALKETSLYSEANESLSAYGTGIHRHAEEIEVYSQRKLFFSPHLTPMTRGILSSLYITLKAPMSQKDCLALFDDFYKDAPFVKVVQSEKNPSTAWVKGSNTCILMPTIFEDKNTLVIFSVIDNLIKGASGQAVQNMNIMLGFEETLGLPLLPQVP